MTLKLKTLEELMAHQNANKLLEGISGHLYMKTREDYAWHLTEDRKDIKPNEPQEETTRLITYFEYVVDESSKDGKCINLHTRWIDTITETFIVSSTEDSETIEVSRYLAKYLLDGD